MEFYHYSNVKVNILKPQIGSNRNNSEDKRIIGKPAIFLTQDVCFYVDGIPTQYRYTVSVSDSDPALYEDQNHKDLMLLMQKEFNTEAFYWHYYTSDLQFQKNEEWDGEKYVE